MANWPSLNGPVGVLDTMIFFSLVDTKEGISESTSHEVEAFEELFDINVSFKVSFLTGLLVHMTQKE